MVPTHSDLTALRREYLFSTPFHVERFLTDGRDAPLAYLMFNMCLLSLPAAVCVVWLNSHWVGPLYWAVNALVFQERFLLGLHFFSHRRLFKNDALNQALALVLPPLFGLPWGVYRIHHVLMHHSGNNGAGMDLSSTEPYQRDSFLQFLCYWLRFLFGIWVELPYNSFARGELAGAKHAAVCIVSYWASVLCLYPLAPHGVFWVLMWPLIPTSFALMLGNWCQHMFITPGKNRSNYHLAYNVINTPSNQRSFNDGYHAEHHVKGTLHWSELPANFMRNIDRYREEDAVVFQGTDFIAVGALVFLGRYDKLAKALYPVRRVRSASETEQFLKERLKPITGPSTTA